MIEQRTEAWYKERCGHVTASRASDVLATIKSGEAAARRNYRAQLVLERLLGRPCEDAFASKAMDIGTAREPYARSWYMDKTGELVAQLGFAKHPTIDWVGCSVDSEVEEGVGGLEIKCPQPGRHMENLLSGGASYYRDQLQFQCWVMGWQWVDLVSFNPDFPEYLRGRIERVARDQAYIDAMEAQVVKFLAEVASAVTKLREMA